MLWKIPPPAHVPVLGGRPSDEEMLTARRDQLAERLAALFVHYEIDRASRDAWHALALRLAQDFVPGFEIRSIAKRERGAAKKWDAFRAARLLADVASITRRGKHKAENACRILTEKPGFAARYGKEKPASLYTRYKESLRIVRADKLLGKMMADAEAQGYQLDDWFIRVFSDRDE
jgi:hypothetical protein